MSVLRQVLCTLIICYLCMSMGLTFTFPSSTMTLFASANTTLHRPITDTEVALFSSLAAIGALISIPSAGFLLDMIGRKYSATLFSMTHVIAWVMIIASNRVEVLFSAIFLSGIGGAAFLVVPLYVSEFCQESIRGGMTSFPIIFYAVGMIISYAIGGFMNYYPMLYVCLSIAVVGIALLCILKESPLYLMQKGRDKEAAQSIAFYRAVDVDSKVVMQEMETIRRALNACDLDSPVTPEEEKLQPEQKHKKLPMIQFIKKSYSTRCALFVCLTLVTASIFQGSMVIQVYAEPLFSEAIPTMSATVSSILFSIISVVAGFLAAYLIDVAGRRPLMIYSSIGSGICCVLLGSQIHVHWGPHAVTAVIIYTFCIVNTLGAGTIPFILSAELFLPEVKSLMSMLVVEWVWLCGSIILFVFNPLVKAIGLGQVFYIFAVFCFGTAVFAFFYLPETRALPVDAIQTLFAKKRSKFPPTRG